MITYDLSGRDKASKYEYLYHCIRRDIRSGALSQGTRLPSKRILARHLNVSVNTVEKAYNLLASEGYLQSKPGSGFYVCANRDRGIYVMGRSLAVDEEDGHEQPVLDFKANKCSLDLFPSETWVRIMRKTLADRRSVLFETVPFNGLAMLRQAIAAHLYEFKGIQAAPERIIIGAGTEYLYGRLLQLFGVNTTIAIGDPGYKKLAAIPRSIGTLWSYIPVDDEGIDVDQLEHSPAEVVHVSPANHFPMGVVMTAERRQRLLDWAHAKPARYIIEDDYDSELRFAGRALPPLYTQDTGDKVIYLNTFSKTLVPSLRISYMVLPETLMDLYRRQLSFYSCTVSSFEQCALAEFISQGYFERHINRLRRYYGRQRVAIMDALEKSSLMAVVTVRTVNVGTHLLLNVNTRLSDHEVTKAALDRGMHLAMLSDYCVNATTRNSHNVVINFASIEPDKIEVAIRLLEDIFLDDIARVRAIAAAR